MFCQLFFDVMSTLIKNAMLTWCFLLKCRYDSGIYVLQFMQNFDGTTMENLCNVSNKPSYLEHSYCNVIFLDSISVDYMDNFSYYFQADILALRAKFLFQIAISPHNKANSEFMKKFYFDNVSVAQI
jgi:hypothetical protein